LGVSGPKLRFLSIFGPKLSFWSFSPKNDKSFPPFSCIFRTFVSLSSEKHPKIPKNDIPATNSKKTTQNLRCGSIFRAFCGVLPHIAQKFQSGRPELKEESEHYFSEENIVVELSGA
jgi:hypothetical protein